jgi:hypothetical protein
MVEKLKSILRRIHWSLLLKAVIFAAAWLVLPFWAFILAALYLYFVPPPQSGTVLVPFLVLLLLMFFEPSGLLFAAIFGFFFFYILLIKNLMLIDRKAAYEVTVLFLVFLLFRDFFMKEGGSFNAFSFFFSWCVAVLVGFLVSGFIRAFEEGQKHRSVRRAATWLSALLVWQLLIGGLFLPLDFVYQTILVFLASMLVIDLIPQHLFNESSQRKILVTSSAVFILLVLVLGSARWGL